MIKDKKILERRGELLMEVFGLTREEMDEILNVRRMKLKGNSYYSLYQSYVWNGLPKTIREYVYKRDNYTCQYCGIRGQVGGTNRKERLCVDHKINKHYKLGTHNISNLVTACNSCNSKKGTLNYDDYIKKIHASNIV